MQKKRKTSKTRKEAEEGNFAVEQACFICGQKATRVIFSSIGHWKLCSGASCYQELTGRYSEGETTWMERALPQSIQ